MSSRRVTASKSKTSRIKKTPDVVVDDSIKKLFKHLLKLRIGEFQDSKDGFYEVTAKEEKEIFESLVEGFEPAILAVADCAVFNELALFEGMKEAEDAEAAAEEADGGDGESEEGDYEED